jgi:hypothetical protein
VEGGNVGGVCVADSGDGWGELLPKARDTYPPKVTALMARYPRHLSLEKCGFVLDHWKKTCWNTCSC